VFFAIYLKIMSFVYYQVHDIIDGDVSDRKGSYVDKEYHVITSPFVLTWIVDLHFFGCNSHGLVHVACNLCVYRS